MENLQTSYEFKVWTDDVIIPKEINLKSINNNNPYSTTPLFLIELRVLEFVQYLLESEDSIVLEEPRGPFIVESFCLPGNAVIREDAADDSLCEILSSVGVPLYSMLPIIQEVSSFARTMMSLPSNFDLPLLPIILGIAVNSWVPRYTATTMSSVSSPQRELKMENLQAAYDFKVWTDNFILPKTINLKRNSSTTPCFMIELRVQEFVQYLPKKGDSVVEEPRCPFIVESFYLPSNAVIHEDAADDSLCEILSSVGVPLYRMLPIIREVSSFARSMMSLPANLGRPLLLRLLLPFSAREMHCQ